MPISWSRRWWVMPARLELTSLWGGPWKARDLVWRFEIEVIWTHSSQVFCLVWPSSFYEWMYNKCHGWLWLSHPQKKKKSKHEWFWTRDGLVGPTRAGPAPHGLDSSVGFSIVFFSKGSWFCVSPPPPLAWPSFFITWNSHVRLHGGAIHCVIKSRSVVRRGFNGQWHFIYQKDY